VKKAETSLRAIGVVSCTQSISVKNAAALTGYYFASVLTSGSIVEYVDGI
jgi:hypothetical protein